MMHDTHSIIRSFSTKKYGDMKQADRRAAYLSLLRLDPSHIVMLQQKHTNHVHTARASDRGRQIESADAVVYRGSMADSEPFALGILTADCVPVLLYDTVHDVIGAAHAGWQGTLGNIAAATVHAMCEIGASAQDIRVFIGPHIRSCCYTVPHERLSMFSSRYPDTIQSLSHQEATPSLDLLKLNTTQLITAGVLPSNITGSQDCTSCANDMYFSYRKNKDNGFGEMLSIVGFVPKL